MNINEVLIKIGNNILEKTKAYAAPKSHDHKADQVTFSDGETFQTKFNQGELKGQKGDTGPIGATGSAGPKGDAGVYIGETPSESDKV